MFRAVRRAKLARVLQFYADKARRHYLPKERYEEFASEIDRMIEKGGDYAFSVAEDDRGWVFCPEFAGHRPLKISPDESSTKVFLFGPQLLPDADGGRAWQSDFDPPRETPSDSRLIPASGVITDSESPSREAATPTSTVLSLRMDSKGAPMAAQGHDTTEVGQGTNIDTRGNGRHTRRLLRY